MTSPGINRVRNIHHTPEAEIAIYRNTLETQVNKPPNDDVRVAAGAESILKDWGKFKPLIKEAFRFRREETGKTISPYIFPNLGERALWKQIDRIDPEGWPANYDNPRAYRKVFPKILPSSPKGQEADFDEFLFDISIREVMSNPEGRGKALQVLINLYPELFGPSPQILDCGASANHILIALAIQYSQAPTEIMGLSTQRNIIANQLGTTAFNGLLGVHPQIGPSIGVDAWPTKDDTRKWQEINTLTPREILAKPTIVSYKDGGALRLDARGRYHLLDSQKPENVGFVWADMTNDTHMEEMISDGLSTKYDAIFASTVLQQQTPEDRHKFIMRMMRFRKNQYTPLIVQDFARPNPDRPWELIFEDDIYSNTWLYNTMIWDSQNPHAGWQVILSHETGRCKKSMLGNGGFIINGEPVKFADRLYETLA